MDIQINSRPLCIVQFSISDIYELLKDRSITYQMKEKNQVLNLISPFQDHRIYLENSSSLLPPSALEKLSSELERMGFWPILIQNEEDRKKHSGPQHEDGKQVWLSFLKGEQKEAGISIYFSFNQAKSSKQLANLLIHNIGKHSTLPVNGVFFEWKNLMNHIFLLSNSKQHTPAVVITGSDLMDLSNSEAAQLSEGLIYALAAFYNQRAFVDLAYYFLNHEKNNAWNAAQEELKPAIEKAAAEQVNKNAAPSVPVHQNSLAWVYQQMAQPVSARQQPKSITSFVGYINKMSQMENPQQPKEEIAPVNMLTLQRRK